MRLVLLLCVIAIIFANEVKKEEPKCDGVQVREKFQKIKILAKGLNRPYQLSYYKRKHQLHFSYNVGKDNEDHFEIAVLHIKENGTEHKPIANVKNGFATAIDEEHDVAYYGGSEGIYENKLNKKTGGMSKIILAHNIWDMFYKHHLYFITYPLQELYKYAEIGKSKSSTKNPVRQKWIHEKIYQFAIDGDMDIFITNGTGLYMIKNNTDHRILLHGEETVFRAIAINNQGEAHFSGKNAIYVPNKHNHTLHKIASIKNIFGLTFDSEDNIIFSDPHQIVKLLAAKCNAEDARSIDYVPIPIPT